ncbi:hypothetical protein LTR36_006309 [Oleoguttula mirabilis]|uniref:Integral membrane protein n=1 Tax=Oleoguttula mirabilis TaxID=1507867 RepID=A0AAV9JEA4_9PEZI|nr:hypothetical protein LTR36_006309 [Oleoguttula mirabilis]
MAAPAHDQAQTELFLNDDPFKNDGIDETDRIRVNEAWIASTQPDSHRLNFFTVENSSQTLGLNARIGPSRGIDAHHVTHHNYAAQCEHKHPNIMDHSRTAGSDSNRKASLNTTTSGISAQSESSHSRGELSGKIKTAADGPVIEAVKSAAHRFHLDTMNATGPSRPFNPTNIRMRVRYDGQPDQNDTIQQQELALLWRSRDNRKGRQSIAVPLFPSTLEPARPRPTSHSREVGKNLWRLCTTFPYWDMAFWSGFSYTIGSALFVIDGAFSFGPLAFPRAQFAGETTYGGPLSFFIGALLYQVGAVMAYLEAVNDGSFHGSAMRRLLEGREEDQKSMLDEKLRDFFGHLVPHHHMSQNEKNAETAANTVDPEVGWRTKDDRNLRPGSVYPLDKAPAPRRGGIDYGAEEGESSTYLAWRWWPSWHTLCTHHVYEIGFLACAIQLLGVTLYGVTAIVILPGILSSLAPWQELGAFWIPQIVAAACFLIASAMFTLETQEKWWKPEPRVLGWWIGVWSVVGSVGFELSAALGTASLLYAGAWAEYQADLSSLWGSAAYLIGSSLQWYEALNKNPVEEMFAEPGEMKSWQVHPI